MVHFSFYMFFRISINANTNYLHFIHFVFDYFLLFFSKRNYRNLSYFLIGSFSSTILFLLFLIFTKISITDFIINIFYFQFRLEKKEFLAVQPHT